MQTWQLRPQKLDYGFLHDTVAGIAAETQGQKDLLFIFHRFLLELSAEEWRLKKEGAGPRPLRHRV